MERLKEYQDKRDFKRTPEPAGAKRKNESAEGHLYIIQKHDAQRLHFDLRLEQEGVLRSWAVPKGPSVKPGEKRLAVEVEDHPLEYADFEGVIPAKNYGGGTVMLWDRGRWQREGKEKSDQLNFILDGERLRGKWTLTRMRKKGDKDDKNWLLIKRSDPAKVKTKAESGNGKDKSIVSGRSMAQIAQDADRTWTRAGEKITETPTAPDASKIAKGRKKTLPKDPRPQLASLSSKAPGGDDWLHEIKFDGYRILARLDKGMVKLITRNGKDRADRFKNIAYAVTRIPVKGALIDGEVVAMQADGSTSFRRLQEAISDGKTDNLIYQVFDLLHVDGYDLRAAALLDRKAALLELITAAGFENNDVIRYTDHIEGRGPAFLKRACSTGLEGIISKQKKAGYQPGRNKKWRKSKCTRHGDFVVVGYTDPSGARTGFGSLLLGAWDGKKLIYSGRVGTGFSDRQLATIHRKLRRLERKTSPLSAKIADARKTHWVRPDLVVEVEFTERTRDGRLRHPAFHGVRDDRNAGEITVKSIDPPPAIKQDRKRKKAGNVKQKGGTSRFAGVRLTHPDRVLFPEQGLTKVDLARYYEEIHDWMLPLIAERPLSLLRCPKGRGETCFFQKHPREAIAPSVPRIEIQEKKSKALYVYVRKLSDLVALVQAGVLEIHPWGSRVDKVEKPDNIVFDLDPGPKLSWKQLIQTTLDLQERLENMKLAAYLRTTGGKGLHIVVPLLRRQGWDEVKAFARAVAEAHASDDPKHLTTNMSKAKRQGRVFLDYLRNDRGATAIGSYSTRAREGAPVAVPLRWDELNEALRSDRYNVGNLARRLNSLSEDPWANFDDDRRAITQAMRKAVGTKA